MKFSVNLETKNNRDRGDVLRGFELRRGRGDPRRRPRTGTPTPSRATPGDDLGRLHHERDRGPLLRGEKCRRTLSPGLRRQNGSRRRWRQ